jgi:twitching motility protein PilU
MGTMHKLLELMAQKKASDIYMAVGAPISIRIEGNAIPINQQRLDENTITALLGEVLTPAQQQEFKDTQELNIALRLPNIGNFRFSVMRQKDSTALVIRFIPSTIPALDSLGLPYTIRDMILEKRGLVLMVGATGSGKSTTLTAMLDHRNTLMSGHIITIEDPIEFVFENKKSIVNQREIGTDTASAAVALKNALRQAPDCILIGEIRDPETMTQAIAYAQTGHLCLATLHANNAYHALSRIISFFPPENRPALLSDIAACLKGIISQRLVRKPDGKRAVVAEVLLNSRYIAELIEKGDMDGIKEAMEKSLSPGSQTFEQALFKMVQDNVITIEEAMLNADSANNLHWLINNQAATPTPAQAANGKDGEEAKQAMSFAAFASSVGV